MAAARRTALVTGANRGIGRAVSAALRDAGLEVVVSARRGADARAAARDLGVRHAAELDLGDEASVAACAAALAADGVLVDALVDNGGVLTAGGVLTTASADWRRAIDVNLLGALWCCRAFVPGMVARGHGRVVNVSSGWGSFAEGLEGPAAYAVAKAALNALTVSLAHDVRGDVKVNACCPGCVRTRMGGADADLDPEQAADGVVWLATLPADGPNGGFFRARSPIGW